MKKYTFTVSESEDGTIHFNSVNDGFDGFAVLGFLCAKTDDVLSQLKGTIKPDTITRTVIKEQNQEDTHMKSKRDITLGEMQDECKAHDRACENGLTASGDPKFCDYINICPTRKLTSPANIKIEPMDYSSLLDEKIVREFRDRNASAFMVSSILTFYGERDGYFYEIGSANSNLIQHVRNDTMYYLDETVTEDDGKEANAKQ